MRRILQRLALAVVAVTGIAAAGSRVPDRPLASDDEAFVPDPQLAKLLAAGFEAALADLHWMRAVQVVGSEAGPVGRNRLLGALVDVVTTLDPWVDHPYRFAAVWLTDDEGAVRKADEILRRGIAHHPDDWRLHFYLAFNQFFYLGEWQAAAAALEPAIALPEAPAYLPRLLARLKTETGGLAASAAFLHEMAEQAPDAYRRAEYEKALDEVETEQRARYLDAARAEYLHRFGRDIERVSDLRGPGRAPRAPARAERLGVGALAGDPRDRLQLREVPLPREDRRNEPTAARALPGALARRGPRLMQDQEVLVRVEALVKDFRPGFGLRKKRVLHGIDFEVRRGEIFGFIGPNGAGKTTTLKILLGLIRASAGRASVLGHDVRETEFRRHVGFSPESPYFYDFLTGAETVDFYARLCGVPPGERPARVARVLDQVGLAYAAGARLRTYSKGMLQRIGVAQAIVHDPSVVFLDEPMSGLDPVGRKEIRDLIVRLNGDGKTIFMNTHILADVEMICDRVAIIVDGRIAYQGVLAGALRRTCATST